MQNQKEVIFFYSIVVAFWPRFKYFLLFIYKGFLE